MRHALVAVLSIAGCAIAPEPKDDCDRAARLFERCGVSLPVLRQRCAGVPLAIARCVVRVGGDCDALASLSARLDECAADAELPPLDEPPLFVPDGGADAGPADLRAADAAPAPDLAAPADLASRWSGLDAAGPLAVGATRSFEAAVEPGRYRFAMTGTGDADLYVRLGHAPTTTLYDCRPFLDDSNEACELVVAALDIAYVTVRADAVASTFHLVATKE